MSAPVTIGDLLRQQQEDELRAAVARQRGPSETELAERRELERKRAAEEAERARRVAKGIRDSRADVRRLEGAVELATSALRHLVGERYAGSEVALLDIEAEERRLDAAGRELRRARLALEHLQPRQGVARANAIG